MPSLRREQYISIRGHLGFMSEFRDNQTCTFTCQSPCQPQPGITDRIWFSPLPKKKNLSMKSVHYSGHNRLFGEKWKYPRTQHSWRAITLLELRPGQMFRLLVKFLGTLLWSAYPNNSSSSITASEPKEAAQADSFCKAMNSQHIFSTT